MSDVNAIINIDINSSSALTNLKKLESEINQFNRSVSASNATAAANQASLNRALLDGINNTGLFTAKQVSAIDSAARFSSALEKNKLTLGEYSRFASSQLPGMSRIFRREFDTMEQVATSRVKKMNAQYLALGRTVDGITKAIESTPTGLARGYSTDMAIAAQKQMMFNKLIDDGSTKLLNWGKNTQWAGRQLMVGLTLPLAAMGAASAKAFMEIDKASVALRRVYGDLSTTTMELETNVEAVKQLGSEYTKYGIAVSETIQIAARAAATGATNEKLMAATEQTLRFATLGQIEYNQALDTTISLQTAFGISNDDLGSKIDFLNAVENQTILTIEDMSLAIPRVATVVRGLGGDVEDLAAFMTAMREGGVSAENAANGLKSGLASMINPTNQASEYLKKFGINLEKIVNANEGDLVGTVQKFGKELDKLSDMDRQRALEKTFGKYQYARMSALFSNMANGSSQAARAMDLASMSAEDLASISEKELGKISESTTVKFQAALEQLKLAIAPIGEAFLKLATPVIEVVTKLADIFNSLPDPIKNAMGIATAAIAGLGPILLMGIGLMGNLVANIIKGVQWWRKMGARIRGDASAFSFMETAQLEANAATHALEGSTQSLTGKLNLQAGAVNALTAEYQRFATVAGTASGAMSGMGSGKRRGTPKGGAGPLRMATGGTVPGSGSGDKIPALLEPGETVVTKEASQKYSPVIAAMNEGSLPEYQQGLNLPNINTQSLNIGSKSSQAIEKFYSSIMHLDNAAEMATIALEQLSSSGKKITKKSFEESLQSLGMQGLPQSERRYNASSAGERRTVEEQLKERGGEGVKEFKVATAASDAAKKAMLEYEEAAINEAIVGGATDEKIAKMRKNATKRVTSAGQIDRAHIIEITNEQKKIKENWATPLWKAQSGAENQFSQILSSTDKNIKAYESTLKGISQQGLLESDKVELMRKVNLNLALTEKELQVQAKVLQKMLKSATIMQQVSPGFGRFATATVAAAEARAKMDTTGIERDYGSKAIGAGKSMGMSSGSAAIGGFNKAIGRKSPAEEFAKGADDAAKGILVGAKRSEKIAAKGGQLLGVSAQQAYKAEMSQLRGSMRNIEIMESAGITDATKQTRVLRKIEEAKVKARKVEELEQKKLTQSVEKNAQITAKTALLAAEQEAASIKENAARQQENIDLPEKGTRGTRGKIMGASMGASSVVIGLSMMDNSIGQFAQKLMPAMIALDVVTTGMTLLGETTFKTAARMLLIAAPWTLAIAAIGLLVWNIKQSEDKQNELIAANQKYIDATLGSAGAMTAFAKQTGKSTLIQQAAASFASSKGITSAQKGFAADFTQGEAGKGLIKSVGMLSGKERLSSLTAQISQAMAAGFLTPGQAKAVARQVSIELNDPMIGHAVVSSINGQLKKDGKTLRKTASEIFMGTISDTMSPQLDIVKNKILENEALRTKLQTQPRPEGATGRTWLAPLGATVSKEEGGAAFQIAATNATKYREALALLTIEKNKGNITQKEYNELSKEASDGLSDQISVISSLNKVLGVDGKSYVGGYFKEYAKGMGMTEEQFAQLESSVESVKNSLGTIPKDFVTKLTFSVASGGLSLDELKNLDSIFKLSEGGAQYKAEYDLLINQEGMSVEDATRFYLSIYNTEDSIKKQIIMVASVYGLKAAENLKAILVYMEQIKNQDLKKKLGIAIEGADAKRLKEAADYLSYLDSVPNKREFVTTLTTYINEITTTKRIAEAVTSGNDMFAIRAAQQGITGSTSTQDAARKAKLDADKAAAIAARLKGQLGDGDDKDGGGSTAKSIIEQLMADTEANLKIFPAMLNKIKNKFKFGKSDFSQSIIDMLGAGESGLKNLEELLNMSKEKVKQLLSDYAKATVAQKVVDIKKENRGLRQSKVAQGILETEGIKKEDAKDLASDVGMALTIISAKAELSAKKFKEFMNVIKNNIKLKAEDINPNQQAIDALNQSIEDENIAYKESIKSTEDSIAAKQKEIDIINEQINSIQELNDADSNRIRNLERQKEMIQRQIDALQRLNDADQQRIETLQREDAIRSRTSDALSHDLDIMSQQETKIKEAYDKRIKALDEVAKINDYIINQQKSQLGLADALSSGDISAAVAIQQDMQAGNAQFATEQMRAGLQTGMENQIAGLTTAGGLTREQAEAQIAAIKEQSYQTSLLIRDIEDAIYNRNLEMLPLKKSQYDIDVLIQGVQDTIYNRESTIISLQTGKLKDLEKELTSYENIKTAMDENLAAKIDSLTAERDSLEMLKAQRDRVDILAEGWVEVKKQISQANKMAQQGITDLGDAPVKGPQETTENFNTRLKNWETKYAAIINKRDNSNAASIASGNAAMATSSAPRGATGMLAYAKGGIVGDGARDSVMAKLTPGEFVMRKASVKKYGSSMLSSMNMGSFEMPRYNVQNSSPSVESKPVSNTANINAPVYNTYSVNVNVPNTNADPDIIANKVMMRMTQIDNSNIRSLRGNK